MKDTPVHRFPSIDQFRNVIRHVRDQTSFVGKDENGYPIFDYSRKMPTLKFQGTVKLHGTNAAVAFDMNTREMTYQSRDRELTLVKDNAGFMFNMVSCKDHWLGAFDDAWVPTGTKTIVVYGEWCGGNIQKGVAIGELSKMFVIFAIKALISEEEYRWLDLSMIDSFDAPELKIYNIHSFPTWTLDIDFSRPELAQNEMIEITNAVEAECPVGKQFGATGCGEGVVWQCIEGPEWNDSGNWFKVKGEKHAASKVKTLAAIDVEVVESIRELVEVVVTESRLEQGLHNLIHEQLKPFEMTSLGDFIKWVQNDILKEELDTLIKSGIEPKKINGPVANKARPWYIEKLNGARDGN